MEEGQQRKQRQQQIVHQQKDQLENHRDHRRNDYSLQYKFI